MTRKMVLVLALVSLVCAPLYAGGAGNCVLPLRTTTKHIGVGGAFEYNYAHNRMNYLENNRGPRSGELKDVNQLYGKLIVGLFDNFNLYLKGGGQVYDYTFVDRAQDAQMLLDLDWGPYGGAGINAHMPIYDVNEQLSLGIGADIQGNFSYNNVKGINRGGQESSRTAGSLYKVDGQNSIYLTCKYNVESMKTIIVPYVGGYQSWAMVGTLQGLTFDTPRSGFVSKENYQAAYDFLSFGVVVGVDVDIAEYVNLNIEGRLVGETALTTGATIKF